MDSNRSHTFISIEQKPPQHQSHPLSKWFLANLRCNLKLVSQYWGGIFQEKILGESVSGPSTSLTWIWGNLGFSNNSDLPFHKSIHLSKREKKLSGIISLNRKTKNLSHALIWMKTKLMKPLPNKWHISLHAVLSFIFCSTYFSPCGCFKFWLCASLCYLMRAISTEFYQCLVFLILLRLLLSSSVFSCITVFPLKAASIRLAFGSLHFFVFCLCISVFLFTALSKHHRCNQQAQRW